MYRKYTCRARQGAASDPGFTGGRQRPQVAGDAGMVAGFNCSAASGMACAEGGVETVIARYREVHVSRPAECRDRAVFKSHKVQWLQLTAVLSMNGKERAASLPARS